jgi:spermidine synthase
MDRRLVLPLFGASLFLSAALLFNVQPMVGKLLLPRVGGSPDVWNVAMAFFQVTLLAGYLLAHALGRLKPLHHGIAYLAVLAAAAMVLPIGLPEGWRPPPTGFPPFAIVGVLIGSVALPFLALSLGAPTLQRLFSASSHADARDPFFLYAASNAGSFVGLLLYPLALEPLLSVSEQTGAWTAGYAALFVVVLAAVLHTWREGGAEPTAAGGEVAEAAPVTHAERLRWIALAAVPSSLTLGVTTHIATDVATTPLLWAVTLGLYLLTFIVAFARSGDVLRRWAVAAQPGLGAAAIATAMVSVLGTWLGVGLQLAAFTATALACHSQLSERRPAARHLTEFYLWLSVGGAIGGSFNAFVAPVVFDRPLEYPLVLVLGLALNPTLSREAAKGAALAGLLGAIAGFGAVVAGVGGTGAVAAGLAAAVFAILALAAPRPWVAVPVGFALVPAVFALIHRSDVFVDRNFFGVVRVRDVRLDDGRRVRQILHGTTVHGAQVIEPEVLPRPIGYYSEYSPISAVFRVLRPQEVGIVGLASGGMNCYAQPGQSFRFYEIDPLMETVARSSFTFLADCPAPVVKIGDGRLLIADEPSDSLDLLVIDAFSSDSVPVHLLTTEAIAMYFQRLNASGALVFNISNRYFDLIPVLSANADALGLSMASSATLPPPLEGEVAFASQWVAMARDPHRLNGLLQEPGWRRVSGSTVRPWTDGYSNPLSALKWSRGYPEAVQLLARQ